MHIDLEKVPTRQQNMKAWELLLSESQERMLLVVEKGRECEVENVFKKWDLEANIIGHVTNDGLLNFYMHGVLEASIPAEEMVLGGGAPVYTREIKEPTYFNEIKTFDINAIDDIANNEQLKNVAIALLQQPNIASKQFVYNQYDSMVGTANTNTNAPSDAAVVLAKETGKALAITVDCNSRYVYANPNIGAMIAVSEAARNIVCSGGLPIGVTNCLNFGNPYNPEVYYQFTEAIKGMGAACRKFNTPVTGGNVSFYNQGPDHAVYPTPTIGMVGVLDDVATKTTLHFKQAGDVIIVVGKLVDDIACSEYVHKILGKEFSPTPYFNLDEEFAMQQVILSLAQQKHIQSAHDCSEGGLLTCLFEKAFFLNKGFKVYKQNNTLRVDAFWLGEAQGRVVISVKKDMLETVVAFIKNSEIQYEILGEVAENEVMIDDVNWGSISEFKNGYDSAIGDILG
jgi:phosphoribosylformylglycinamidine synthase